jgi:DNA-binding HxlR family transcriptional regulator
MAGATYTDPGGIERALALQVLRDDHHERWTRKELKRELPDVKGRSIDKALDGLEEEGVVELDGEYVWPSRCAQYLNALGMVSV